MLDSPFPQPLSRSSLVYLMVWNPLQYIHFFTQSLSSFSNTCPYHRSLFCCSTEIMSSSPNFSLFIGKITQKAMIAFNFSLQLWNGWLWGKIFYVEPNMRGKCEITGFGITCMCILPICYMRSEVWVISYQQGCIAVCLCKSRLLLRLVPLIHS